MVCQPVRGGRFQGEILTRSLCMPGAHVFLLSKVGFGDTQSNQKRPTINQAFPVT